MAPAPSLCWRNTQKDTYHLAARSAEPFTPKADAVSRPQVSENAKQDLKDGLALYNSETNLGLRNAWNIIQAEVGASAVMSKRLMTMERLSLMSLSPLKRVLACFPASSEAERLIKIQNGVPSRRVLGPHRSIKSTLSAVDSGSAAA